MGGVRSRRTLAAMAVALAVAVCLVVVHVAAGGGRFEPTPVADACQPRPRPAGVEATQRAALAVLDGAACELGLDRERLLLVLLDSRRPGAAENPVLTDALRGGVRRARAEGAVTEGEAGLLDLALRTGALDLVLDRLLPEPG